MPTMQNQKYFPIGCCEKTLNSHKRLTSNGANQLLWRYYDKVVQKLYRSYCDPGGNRLFMKYHEIL